MDGSLSDMFFCLICRRYPSEEDIFYGLFTRFLEVVIIIIFSSIFNENEEQILFYRASINEHFSRCYSFSYRFMLDFITITCYFDYIALLKAKFTVEQY